MATIIFAPIISEARGKVSDCVFSIWKGRPYIRQRVIPANPQSAAQTAVRESLARCVDLWQSIENQLKVVWNTYATGYRMSGFNKFMSQNRADEQIPSLLQFGVPNTDIDPATTFTPVTGVGAAGDIDCAWTGGTVGANYYAYILCRKATLDEVTVEDTDATLFSAAAVTLSGLVAGATYDVYLLNEENVLHDFSISKSGQCSAKA